MNFALGLIETKGLIAAIVAADAMTKAANVKIIGKEKITAAKVTIKIAGEVAAVKAALEAGAQAAIRYGELISVHVIPNPDEQLEKILNADLLVNYNEEQNKNKEAGLIDISSLNFKQLENMSVENLRKLARSYSNFPLSGREIAKSNKETLLGAFRKALNLK